MQETISAIYEDGVLLPLEDVFLEDHQKVRLHILPQQVRIAAAMARRKVGRFLLDEVSYLMGCEQPTLIQSEQFYWRVPITLTYPTDGSLGVIGSVDVNAETGELLISATLIEAMKQNARDLAARYTPEAEI